MRTHGKRRRGRCLLSSTVAIFREHHEPTFEHGRTACSTSVGESPFSIAVGEPEQCRPLRSAGVQQTYARVLTSAAHETIYMDTQQRVSRPIAT
eukprot:8581853-Lingulodinium_polyedra.AAC.1